MKIYWKEIVEQVCMIFYVKKSEKMALFHIKRKNKYWLYTNYHIDSNTRQVFFPY